jgi:hypothetical protein
MVNKAKNSIIGLLKKKRDRELKATTPFEK